MAISAGTSAGISAEDRRKLEKLCQKFRRKLIDVLHAKQTGHPGGSLSVCEILVSLYFHQANVDSGNPGDPNRDRIILSKGHAAPMLYLALAEKGFFPYGEIDTLRDFETRLQGHPSIKDTPGVELSTGPLGLGLSAGLGMALALRLDRSPARVYVVLGDGEINEGTVWEAAMAAAKFKADGLTAILDWNRVQLDGATDDVMPSGDLGAKFVAFGWNTIHCDGHDIGAICRACDEAAAAKGRPSIVLAHTVKGKGVSFMEGKSAWHGSPIKDADYEIARRELDEGVGA
ncbi:MAG: transketolase [Clostridiales bacterium]|jgi:transketolase|nr:transketolase [Clostridiales bacterium]